jgi:pimeloyl-ACP methyl ester carboxylesterase
MMSIEEKFVEAGNIRTKYLEAGAGEPLLLIHGLGYWSGVWKYNIEVLAQKYRVIAPDVVGYGKTDIPRNQRYDLDLYIKWLDDFITSLNLSKVILVGNSLGGAIVTIYAGTYPKKVTRVITLAPAGIRKNVILLLRLMSLPVLGKILGRPSYRGIMTFWKNTIYNHKLIPEELVKENFELSKQPLGNYALLQTLKTSVNIRGIQKKEVERAKKLAENATMPMLVIWGDKDKVLPIPKQDDILNLFPHAKIEFIENCGHTPMIETPELFHKLTLEFLHSTMS